MSRSKWKGPILKNTLNKLSLKNLSIPRNSTIPAFYLDKFVNIYTGKDFKKIYISKEKIGIKFGSFAYTRKGKSKVKNSRKKK